MSNVIHTNTSTYYGVTGNVTKYRSAQDAEKVSEKYTGSSFADLVASGNGRTRQIPAVDSGEQIDFSRFAPNAQEKVKQALGGESNGTASQEKDYRQFLQEKMNEIFVKIQNGDTEPSYQIGSQSFTEEEWDDFLEQFDSTDLLTAESTSCIYPTAAPEDEDIRYITYYSEDGIHCRKVGETKDMWSIAFESEEQYEKVMNLIEQFPSDWNMRFAAHENFWTDFLKDEIDIDGFMEFMEGTNQGVPDYSITVGDSMYVDKEKAQWAEYLNPLGSRFYTAEEMNQQQMELMAANMVNKTRVTNSVENRVSGDAKTDAFYSGLSSAVEVAESKGTGEVLGLTMLPYSDSVSYGMSAFYSEKSTEADPIIRINSNYGGKNRYFDVHVNEVDPGNASQLEMFALSCYMDDQGLTNGGTFGSYSRMKTYALNDSYLGQSPDLQNPENVESKMDWVAMLKRMAEEYLQNAQTYSQYLDCGELATALEKWNVYF